MTNVYIRVERCVEDTATVEWLGVVNMHDSFLMSLKGGTWYGDDKSLPKVAPLRWGCQVQGTASSSWGHRQGCSESLFFLYLRYFPVLKTYGTVMISTYPRLLLVRGLSDTGYCFVELGP